uniref:Uncharacterized protein n=1 Tax=Dulem virus 29 TaxID=3145747 RepID=A0AAU8B4H8_9CAUD
MFVFFKFTMTPELPSCVVNPAEKFSRPPILPPIFKPTLTL